ncbi:MAG TPA: hypothetical protein VGE21_09215 [Flavobacteriales bacterium]
MSGNRYRRLPTLVIALVAAACAYVDLDLRLWRERDRVIEWDVHSYYAYLPAVFIYDDIELEKSDYRFDGDYYLFWPSTTERGTRVIKTTMGLAVLYSPFFFLGHGLAHLTGAPPNGWSPPYKGALIIGGLFYLVLGLHLTRRILERAGFTPGIIALTLLTIGAGTNLFCYASQSASMSHVHSFFLLALFVHLTTRWYERTTLWRTVALGVCMGLIALVRPTNCIVGLFFVLHGIDGMSAARQRVRLFLQRWPHLLLLLLLAAAVWVPQLLYWRSLTGSYFFNPYIGERFFFDRPKLLEGLFGFRKGWLIYTPLMGFSVAGLFFMNGTLRSYRAGVTVFLALTVYTTFSWWCWWYGGSFGQRSMVDGYALLALPMAASFRCIWSAGTAVRTFLLPVIGAGIGLNIFQTYQFEEGSLHSDSMSKELYFRQFGRMDKVNDFDRLLVPPDYERARLTGR